MLSMKRFDFTIAPLPSTLTETLPKLRRYVSSLSGGWNPLYPAFIPILQMC